MPEFIFPAARELVGDPESIDPKGLNFYRFADTWCYHPITHLGVHPGQLHSWLTCGEQGIIVHSNAVSCSAGIAFQNRFDRAAQNGSVGSRSSPLRQGLQVFVSRDNKPERGI